jgi:hypothetical protein
MDPDFFKAGRQFSDFTDSTHPMKSPQPISHPSHRRTARVVLKGREANIPGNGGKAGIPKMWCVIMEVRTPGTPRCHHERWVRVHYKQNPMQSRTPHFKIRTTAARISVAERHGEVCGWDRLRTGSSRGLA